MDKQTVSQNLNRVIDKTDFKNLGPKYVGKVRDVYEQKDKIILIATDRYSAFDRNLALIPFKGQVLTQVSKFWFDKTKNILQNHIIDVPDQNVTVVRKCKVLPVEVVVRVFITGVTGTSIWTLYERGQREFGGVQLPEGMKKNQKLSQPIITPTTKMEEHDRPLTDEDIIGGGLVEKSLWQNVKVKALEIFEKGQKMALDRGLILVDVKYEFGLDENGKLTLIDEVHTPDSSRYWQAASYKARIEQGLEPEYFDKEFLRLWFKEHSDPYKDKTMPKAPPELVAELSYRYIQIYEQITDEKFVADLDVPILDRIKKNLKSYTI